ncbi:hypothetical protein ANCDUO_24380 [Ancylostoma duodenale]|uniref:Uncharacterized protein n=1 Tax=Ancylostoma duodenale TaxID=51022 RepID=A0A0C2FAK5_9BILA|nr:hypothetical protein ANCDUO_24380 [Ancylostoma duodenale]
MAPSLMSPLALTIVCMLLFVGICTLCTGVIVAIVRVRRKRQKMVFAPHWAIPGDIAKRKTARENGLYHPPTPPDSNSPEYGNDEDQYKKESPFLLAVRRGDHRSVQQMIHSSENYIDALVIQNYAYKGTLPYPKFVALRKL